MHFQELMLSDTQSRRIMPHSRKDVDFLSVALFFAGRISEGRWSQDTRKRHLCCCIWSSHLGILEYLGGRGLPLIG